MGKISAPLRDRFGVVHRLDFYEDSELGKILETAAIKLQLKLETDAALLLAGRARKTARVALKLLKRVRDYSQIYNNGVIDKKVVTKALDLLEVDKMGLDANDRMILRVIIEKHDGGPVGLTTLAASTAEDVTTIEDMYEPFLMRAGFIKRTPKGRVVTRLAYEHLGVTPPTFQDKLL
jgi:Holliday junction DNA helicase RuvB